MIGPFRPRFRAHRDGSTDFRIADEERSLIETLLDQYRELLMSTAAEGSVHETLRRLYPTAHPNDAEADAAYHELVRDELLERRLEKLEVIEATLQHQVLSASEALAWVTVLNDIRLVLGTSLDVSEDDDFDSLDLDDPNNQPYAVYRYLSALQEEFVRVLS